MLDAIDGLDNRPDVLCSGGYWLDESGLSQSLPHVGYRALAAVTHVNGSARIQTVSAHSNKPMFDLLTAFKARTGYGVLCNTSLNFNGMGCINAMGDLDRFTDKRKLDGFVVDGRAYLLKSSPHYQAYQRLAAAS